MKLKLDLHEIFNNGRKIEEALQDIIEEAVTKRASEVEIIPGKGSGALKKSVLRFLDRPEIKAEAEKLKVKVVSKDKIEKIDFIFLGRSESQEVAVTM